jgi:hypothetical protein
VSKYAHCSIINGGASWVLTHQPPDPTRVSNLQDNDRPGSLRYAVDDALPKSTITFDASLHGTILLSSGDLNIGKDLKILGPGADKLSISGGKSGHIVHVVHGASVTISGLTFKDSNSTTGFIDNEGTLTLSNSTVSGNTVTGFISAGGGIFNSHNGTLTLSNSTVSGNTVTGGNGGGGIAIQSFVDASGALPITQVDITFSTMYGNAAHGGGDIAIEDDAIDSNGNRKAIKQVSQVKISNSIVAGDPAHPGPDIVGMLTSDGYNLFQDTSGATFDPATRTQHGTDKTLSVNNLTTLFASPLVLRENGGPTKTLTLAHDSPAVDQIPLAACHINGITTDQRGMKRPDDNESACDIGAYEYVDSPT